MGRNVDVEHGMTKAGLVARLAMKFHAEETKLASVVAAWAKAGILKPEGGPHRGRGVFRTFSENELAKAAILFELSSYALPIQQLILARERIDLRLKKTPQAFEEARNGKRWYFLLSLIPGRPEGFVAGEFVENLPSKNQPWTIYWDQEIGKQKAPISARSAIVVSVDQVLMKL